MMEETIDTIDDRADVEWKFARSRLYMEYIRDGKRQQPKWSRVEPVESKNLRTWTRSDPSPCRACRTRTRQAVEPGVVLTGRDENKKFRPLARVQFFVFITFLI